MGTLVWLAITSNTKMATALFGVTWFDQSHTTGNIMEAKSVLMAEWGIASKVQCNLLCTHTQSYCNEALDQTPAVQEIGSKARKIVGLFRSSHKARDKLVEMQGLMGRPPLELIQEVETRWNSTFDMLQQLHDQREPVGCTFQPKQWHFSSDKLWIWSHSWMHDTPWTIKVCNNTAVRGAVSVGIQTVEVKKYLTDAFVPRKQDALTCWDERRVVYPHLYMLAKKYDLLLTYAKSRFENSHYLFRHI